MSRSIRRWIGLTPGSFLILAGVLITGLGATAVGFGRARNDERSADLAALGRVQLAVASTVDRSGAALTGASAIVDDRGVVETGLFRVFADEVIASSSLRAMADVRIVQDADRMAFEQETGRPINELSANGLVRSGRRDEYWVVVAVQPVSETTNQILGFDLGSEPRRRQALEQARDTGGLGISEPIESQPTGAPALFMGRALYRGRVTPTTENERRSQLIGFVTSSLPGRYIVEDAATLAPRVRFAVYDGATELGATDPSPRDGQSVTGDAPVSTRTWTITVDDGNTASYGLPGALFAATLLAGLVTVLLMRRRDRTALEQQRIVEVEHRIVGQFQKTVLATPLVSAPLDFAAHYESATGGSLIGGDWYDIFELAEDRIVVVVGDVGGHGVDAIALMMEVRTGLRTLIVEGLDPSTALHRLDLMLAGRRPLTTATAVALIIDPAAATVTFASAGHPPPIMRMPDGAVDVLAEPHGSLLGAGMGAPPQNATAFPVGSMLVVYTDGLVERRRENIDVSIGLLERRVGNVHPETTPAAEICAGLIAAQSTPNGFGDDVVLVIVGHRPTPSNRT